MRPLAYRIGQHCVTNMPCDRCRRKESVVQGGLFVGGMDVYWTGKDWVCSTCWLKELFP